MELGWIDFSKDERAKVLDVINLLSEDGTLDELGISAIRDGFANIFFPGTSTIQTRAKYFLIVPYALADLEYDSTTNPRKITDKMNDIERKCGETLLRTSDEGIIGSRNLKSGNWVLRTPVNIYWNGIRTYGIFTGGNMSYYEYVKASCFLRTQKKSLKSYKNIKDGSEEGERDDSDAGSLFTASFWKLPDYMINHWIDDLVIDLTKTEAVFLKKQIMENCPGSLLAFILRNNMRYILEFDDFGDLGDAVSPYLPDDMKDDIALAKAASEFIYGMRIRYNVILSLEENEEANSEWAEYEANLSTKANVDFDKIFYRLKIANPGLRGFLRDIQKHMLEGDIAAMDERIIKRECQLKTKSRAKLLKAGEFPADAWLGGGRLDYRFLSARQIMQDIFNGEGDCNV